MLCSYQQTKGGQLWCRCVAAVVYALLITKCHSIALLLLLLYGNRLTTLQRRVAEVTVWYYIFHQYALVALAGVVVSFFLIYPLMWFSAGYSYAVAAGDINDSLMAWYLILKPSRSVEVYAFCLLLIISHRHVNSYSSVLLFLLLGVVL